jgi:hypothetical protein
MPVTEKQTNDALAAIPTAGAGLVRLELLGVEGESVGRERFERLVTSIVWEMHPTARAVKANPGDWGIDTFVGELSGGTIAVWQSKYFVNGLGEAQHAEVRDSFRSVMKAAEREGFRVASWTLVVSTDLDGPATKWWDGWRKRTERTSKVAIDLWPGSHVEGLLRKPDIAGVRQQFFGLAPGERPAERTVEDPDDWSKFDNALFIKQLRVAGITQDQVARRAFFNADVMARDIQEREVRAELQALGTVHANLHQMWHTRFEAEKATCDPATTKLPRLYPELMAAIEVHHGANPSPELRDTLVHRTGLVHHLVEAGQAGWVRNFDDVVREHMEESG